VAKPNLRLIMPATENRTVTPQRPTNAQLRTREHLTADEVERLIEAAKANRHGYRDALMVLLAYRHGLRAAEVVDLRWWGSRWTSKPHPCTSAGPRTALQQRTHSAGVRCASSAATSGKARRRPLCLSRNAERRYRRQGSPAWSSGQPPRPVWGIKAHAHMLRHACGYKLANDDHDTRAIQAYLGHRNIQNTTRYTTLAPQRFKEFFRD
jgi:integrase